MKSYFLGIVAAIALSVIYVTYNTAEVAINYLGFQAYVNQGLWDVFLFSIGAIIMWVLSIGASIESYTANKKRYRELNQKIEDLENEKKSLLAAMQNIGNPKRTVQTHEIFPEIMAKEDAAPEKITPEEKRPSPVKSFFASIFKSDRGPEPDKTKAVDQAGAAVQAETSDQTEVCDKAEVCGQTEVFDQIEVCDQTEDVDHVEPFQTEVCYPNEDDDKIEADGDEAEAGENAEEDERDDNPSYGSVCELDLELDHDEVPEDEDDPGEKEDRGIFTV